MTYEQAVAKALLSAQDFWRDRITRRRWSVRYDPLAFVWHWRRLLAQRERGTR